MHITATAVLSIAILGAAITPGWCPEPADVTSPHRGSTGATGAHVGPWQPGEGRKQGESASGVAVAPPRGDARNRLMSSPPTSAAMDRLGGGTAYRAPGGGINKTGSQSGIAPMKNTQQNTPQARGPVVSARPSGPDRNIDYGACPGCGKRDTFRPPR